MTLSKGILVLVLSTQLAWADAVPSPSPSPKVTCNQVIEACDKALADKERVITVDNATIKQLSEHNIELDKKVKEKDEQLGSIIRNPFVLIGLGLIGGFFISTRFK